MKGVLVVYEDTDGSARISAEALAAGRQIAAETQDPVFAAAPGNANVSGPLERYAVDRAYAVEHELLRAYTADAFTDALEQLIRAVQPAFVVFPHTYRVRDFAPSLAARFGEALIADVVGMAIEDGRPVFVRQLFQGKLNAEYVHNGEGICFVSVQAGAWNAEGLPEGPTEVEVFTPELNASSIRTRPEPRFREAERTVDLTSAPVIVSVGRGIKERENIPVVEELARVLGAEVAASRPICDNGWLPMERQVGSSGQTVAPKLYMAVGISGAIQHLVGMKGSKSVIAINKDENAPIFEVADYAVVGDLFEIVPALTAAVRKAKGG